LHQVEQELCEEASELEEVKDSSDVKMRKEVVAQLKRNLIEPESTDNANLFQ